MPTHTKELENAIASFREPMAEQYRDNSPARRADLLKLFQKTANDLPIAYTTTLKIDSMSMTRSTMKTLLPTQFLCPRNPVNVRKFPRTATTVEHDKDEI